MRFGYRSRAVLLIAFVAVSASSARAAGAEGTLPNPDLLDLFGNRGPAAETRPALNERDREIRRSDQAAPRAGSEQALVRRRAGEARSWQLWDFMPLLVVLALVIGLGLVVKRFLPARTLLGAGGAMHVLARTPLSSKQQLVLVQLGRRLLLLGVTPERISTLSVVEDPDQVALLLGEVASGRPGSLASAFTQSFDEETGAYLPEQPLETLDVSASGQVRGLLEKVRSLKQGKGVA